MITKVHLEILDAYTISVRSHSSQDVIKRWQEPHRFYHNIDHLNDLLVKIDALGLPNKSKEYIILVLIAFYHDVVYDPLRGDNEEKSAEFFKDGIETLTPIGEEVYRCILDTKEHVASSEISQQFINFDLHGLAFGNIGQLVNDGMKVYKEYQFYDYSMFKIGRIKILERFAHLNPMIEHYVQWFETWKPNVGIYPGSFDPFHVGHKDIMSKGEAIFDKVIIAQGKNLDKDGNNSYEALKRALPYKQVDSFDGMLADYVTSKEETGIKCTIIRGLRNSTDLQYEKDTAFYVKRMKQDIKYVYIPCDVKYESVSSSAIRKIEKETKGGASDLIV